MSLLSYFKKSTDKGPLVVKDRPRCSAPVVKKRKVGRPRKKAVTIDLVGESSELTHTTLGNAESGDKVTDGDVKGKLFNNFTYLCIPDLLCINIIIVLKMRTRYSNSQKAKVAHHARFHGSRAAARKFSIHHKNAQRWLKENLDKVRLTKRSKRCNRSGQGRKLSYPPEIDEQLYKWVLERREQDLVAVSSTSIKMKALSLIKPILPDFKASVGWFHGFMLRNNLSLRAKTGVAQMLPADLEEKVAHFRQSINHIRQNSDFDYDFIANMDETPIYLDMVPSKTVDRKGKKTIKIRTTKSEKCHVTAVLACSSTGNMLPPMVIFKGKTARAIHGVEGSNGTLVSYQEKAWMDESGMLKWIDRIWIKYTKKKPSLLFLDCFKAHLTEKVKEAFGNCNTTVLVIPGGCTSVLQPLDVSINKPIKSYIRHSWEQYMIEKCSGGGNAPKPSKQLLVDWLQNANHMLDSNKCIVKKSFLVTGLSNSLGRHEDHLIRNDDIRDEITEIISMVFGKEYMGYQELCNLDGDPFQSMDESSDDPLDGDVAAPSLAASISVPDDESEMESASSSIEGPEFEPLSDTSILN